MISVTDASAVWFLQILAATAQASLPIAPHLQSTILEHTKIALGHIPPLSLSPNAREKPGFLSPRLLKEVDSFLRSLISPPPSPFATLGIPAASANPATFAVASPSTADGLGVLLSFALARGNVAAIIEVLIRLFNHATNGDKDEVSAEADVAGNPSVSDASSKALSASRNFPSRDLLTAMSAVRTHFWRKHATQLDLSLLAVDSGQKDDTCPPSMILSGNWSSDCYQTAEGELYDIRNDEKMAEANLSNSAYLHLIISPSGLKSYFSKF